MGHVREKLPNMQTDSHGRPRNISRVVLVSNRVMDLRKATQAGGVAVAIADILRSRNSLWFGWNGETTEGKDVLPVTREGRIATVPLTPVEFEQYYLGYANSVLWPVFHNRLDLAAFEAGYFEQYVGVNRRLATALQPLLRPDDVIWIHDYHLIPFASELRKLGVENAIGFYLHIPFPPWQTFMAIPENEQLARALAAYDLIGVQTKADVANVIDYMSNGVYGRIVPDGRIRAFDRLVSVASFPVGIDVADFAHVKRDSSLAQGRGVRRIIGIDRLDYTKGLPQKFKAFGEFLQKYPQYQRQVVLTQIAPPTRASVEAYTGIRQQLESLAGSINGRFGELDWVPIHYIHRSTARRRLGDIYRASQIGLVTPLRDGMNLVAKEYVAAQNPEDPGVLILSRFAGAAEELGDALIVNPYNIGAVADMIRVALEMDLPERRARHRALMSVVEKHNSAAWSQSFLDTLERSSQSREVANWPSSENIRTALDALRLSANPAKPEKTRRTPRKSRTMGSDQAVSTVSETKQ
jgi:trehalose 6-phosphate synthase